MLFQLACARIQSEEGQDYLKGMAAAANYAWVNRSSMTYLTRQVGTFMVEERIFAEIHVIVAECYEMLVMNLMTLPGVLKGVQDGC